MSEKVFNSAEQAKLKQIVNEGISILQEVADLNGGLNDTIKAVAEEMDIKPGVLKKAIKVAFKAELVKSQEEHELLETILESVGKTA
jgi:DNA-binding IscR family transcriptional regulator